MGQDETTMFAQEPSRPQPGRPSGWEAWRNEIQAFCADMRAELAAIAQAVANDLPHDLPPVFLERGTAQVERYGSSGDQLLHNTAGRLEKLKQQLAARLQGEATRLPDEVAERPDPCSSAASHRMNT